MTCKGLRDECVLEVRHRGPCKRLEPVANRAECVANSAKPVVANKLDAVSRVRKWRETNRERYNEREKNRMREVRKKKKGFVGIAYG